MFLQKLLVSIVIVFAASTSWAEPEMVRPESLSQGFVLVVKDETGKADKDHPIYLASSINGWNPSDEEMMLSGRSDLRFQIVVDRDLQGVGMQFKFTLGGWDQEELDGSGEAIANRSLPMVDKSKLAKDEKPVIELSVVEFRVPVSLAQEVRQAGLYRELNVTGDVRRIEVRGGSGGAESMTRDLLVWLPAEYDALENAGREYPVLYMCDGQNLFEQIPGVAGEWHADETATALIKDGKIRPMIIVGIPHAKQHRINEYLPFGSIPGGKADGAAFVDWLIREAMPRVNRAFRTATGSSNTAIGGASLGGSIALYASTARSDVFGSALVESLPLLGDDGKAVRSYLEGVDQWPDRVFVGMGGREVSYDAADTDRNKMYRQWAVEIRDILKSEGLDTDRLKLVIEPKAHHHEPAWAERFGRALEFLYAQEN
jgi:predicted alpha/beta superfamily hydrolase